MTRNDLKNYISTQHWIDDQLEMYQNKMIKLGINLDGLPKAHNKPNYATEEIMDSYKELMDMVKEEQQKLVEIVKQLNYLKPLHKSILFKRYIEGKKLEQVSIEVGYSYNRTCTYNGNALDEFDKFDKLGKKC